MRGDPKMWALAGKYSAVGLEFGLAIVVGLYGGEYLDERFNTKPYLGYAGLVFGLAAGILGFWRTIKNARVDQQR